MKLAQSPVVRLPAALALFFVHTAARFASREESIEPTDDELVAAVISDDMDIIESIISCGKNVERFIYFKGQFLTPAMITCLFGKPAHLAKLIGYNVQLDRQNSDGITALLLASLQGHHQVVASLINAQVDVNLQEIRGRSPLYFASLFGHCRVVELLINAQAAVDQQDNNGESPLQAASRYGHHPVVELLIKAHADVNIQNNSGETPHMLCLSSYATFESFINARADVNIRNVDGVSALHEASRTGDLQLVSLAISALADVNLQTKAGESALYIASIHGQHQVVEFLVKAYVEVNLQRNTGSSPLYIAAYSGYHQVVESLIRAQADVNLLKNTGSSALYIAAQNGHHRVAELLIEAQADVNSTNTKGCSPLYVAAQNGHQLVVESLIKALADVNQRHGVNGCSPLYIAAQSGHNNVVKQLIRAQANDNIRDETCGLSPINIAERNGHRDVVDSLIGSDLSQISLLRTAGVSKLHRRGQLGSSVHQEKPGSLQICSLIESPSCTDLSWELHSALCQSGFVESRAALQSAAADVLQEIQRRRKSDDGIHVVGSFSEGWGNSLITLDGRTDVESDIDMMQLLPGRPFHMRGLCDCNVELAQTVEYNNGHILSSGYAANPATAYIGSALRPAVDQVTARRLCGYPPIGPLQPDRVTNSNIPDSVLLSLQQEMKSLPCHVVHAAPPGMAGQQLRVSTSFLERLLLRCLSTLQGQLFVTLKWLLKKAISHKGFKSYHAKTITFRMLEVTPAEQWTPENLLNLVQRSLQMLLEGVENGSRCDRIDGRIREHFFLCEAAVYLRGVDLSSQESARKTMSAAADALRDVVNQLPQVLRHFRDNLQPVSNSGRFCFHPFLVLPTFDTNSLSSSGIAVCEYHEIYDIVREAVLRVSDGDCSPESRESLASLTSRLPDCARSARESLRALACLKFGDRETAARILSDSRAFGASRGIDWSAARSASEATADLVWQHLKSRDSAWKFCFRFDPRPELPIAHKDLADCFPLQLGNYGSYFYMNFDALGHALHAELVQSDDRISLNWIQDVARRQEADAQEVMAAAAFSTDLELLKLLDSKNSLLSRQH